MRPLLQVYAPSKTFGTVITFAACNEAARTRAWLAALYRTCKDILGQLAEWARGSGRN